MSGLQMDIDSAHKHWTFCFIFLCLIYLVPSFPELGNNSLLRVDFV